MTSLDLSLHVCDECKKTFSRKDALTRHKKIHTQRMNSLLPNVEKPMVEDISKTYVTPLKRNKPNEKDNIFESDIYDIDYKKKYALIPDTVVSRHVPTPKQLSDLDKQMAEVLNSSRSEHEKVSLYHTILQKKMNMENFNVPWTSLKNRPDEDDMKVEESPAKKNDYDEWILQVIPNSYKQHAKTLLQLLKTKPNIIRWNEDGEMIYRGESRKNSNILDLMGLIFTHTPKTDVPGKEDFLNAMRDVNAPSTFIKNKYLNQVPVKQEKISPVKRKRRSVTLKWAKLK